MRRQVTSRRVFGLGDGAATTPPAAEAPARRRLDDAQGVRCRSPSDSDGDGAPDIAELRAGEDPNVPAEGAMVATKEIPLPETGCSFSRVDGTAGTWSLFVVLVFGWLRKKRRGQLAALTRPTPLSLMGKWSVALTIVEVTRRAFRRKVRRFPQA
jgi:hypothetical protein